MKKINLLAITPILIASTGVGISFQNRAAEDIELSSAITSNTNFFFKNTYQIDSTVQIDGLDFPIQYIDQIGANNRVNRMYVQGYLYDEFSVVKSGAGHALQEYISTENEVKTRTLTHENGEPVNYDIYYGNPFKSFANLSNSQINSYFNISEKDSNYVLTANDLAYGALTKSLVNFYPEMNAYIWDYLTYNVSIEDLEITILNDGTPSSMSFTRVKKDRFGAIQEPIVAKFESLSKIQTVQALEPKMSENDALEFETKITNFQEKLSAGNFTQHISIEMDEQLIVEYGNYYAYTGNQNSYLPSMAISDCPLYDPNYGYTFVTLTLTSEGYIPYAVSPESSYEGKMNDTVYTSIDEIIPHFDYISSDFFEKVESYYVFDLLAFLYSDVQFASSILTDVLSIFDPGYTILGLYLDNYTYTLDCLYLGFDSNGNLFGELTYFLGSTFCSAFFTFEEIGTTVLEDIPSIASALDFFYLY